MSEADISSRFVTQQQKLYKKDISIEKRLAQKVGDPDIVGVYLGMPFFLEAKLLNSITYKNLHQFKEKQIAILQMKSRSGALVGGLLYYNSEIRFLECSKLKVHLSKEDWDSAEEFDLTILRDRWYNQLKG